MPLTEFDTRKLRPKPNRLKKRLVTSGIIITTTYSFPMVDPIWED